MNIFRYGAPAFISLPHFYMADGSYTDAIEGMMPNSEKHKVEMVIEPNYGFPIEAHIGFQVNFKLNSVKEIR